MPDWRRTRVPGGSYFFTLVTDNRQQILCEPLARTLLGRIIRRCQSRWPFTIDALVLLPDHLHAIWTLPSDDDGYSRRWAWIKKEFTKHWVGAGGSEQGLSAGRQRDGRRGVWQPKFWEHTLQDDEDFSRHFDYVHYNPVKHGYASCPGDWLWSTFHRWVKAGFYPTDWACGQRNAVLDFSSLAETVGE